MKAGIDTMLDDKHHLMDHSALDRQARLHRLAQDHIARHDGMESSQPSSTSSPSRS